MADTDADFVQPPLPNVDWPVEREPTRDDDLMDLHRRLAELLARNMDLYQQVTAPMADGRRPQPDPVGILGVRMECLIDWLMTTEHDRVAFETAVEERMTEVLRTMVIDRTKLELLTPAGKPGLIVPK